MDKKMKQRMKQAMMKIKIGMKECEKCMADMEKKEKGEMEMGEMED